MIIKNDETVSTLHISVNYMVNSWGIKYVQDVLFEPDFDREEHGMWKMELCDQLREQGYSTEYLN